MGRQAQDNKAKLLQRSRALVDPEVSSSAIAAIFTVLPQGLPEPPQMASEEVTSAPRRRP